MTARKLAALVSLAALTLGGCAGDHYGETLNDRFSTGLVADRDSAIRAGCAAFFDDRPQATNCPLITAERDEQGDWDVRGPTPPSSGDGLDDYICAVSYTVSGLDGHMVYRGSCL